ncbi:MAG: hypothetical protein QW231_02565, partial [Candidatus Bathyarchaeia archaeon]
PVPGEPRNSSSQNHGCGYGSNSCPGSDPSSAFPILEFGALDLSAPEGFRRFVISSDRELERLRNRYANKDVYASIFRYESPDFENSNSRLYGPYYADLDSQEDPEKALKEARELVEVLRRLGIPEASIRLYFSGAKGFHVEVPLETFGGEPHRDLNKIWKRLSEWIEEYLHKNFQTPKFQTLDWNIYDRRRLWRLSNSQNGKTGLYKVPLSVDELFSLDLEAIKSLAKAPRDFPSSSPPHPPTASKSEPPKENLMRLWEALVYGAETEEDGFPVSKERRPKVGKPYQGTDPPCIINLWNLRLREGEGRNEAALRLFCYLHNFKGFEAFKAIEIVKAWNARQIEPLGDRELESVIKSGASKGYVFGCEGMEAYGCDRKACPLASEEREGEGEKEALAPVRERLPESPSEALTPGLMNLPLGDRMITINFLAPILKVHPAIDVKEGKAFVGIWIPSLITKLGESKGKERDGDGKDKESKGKGPVSYHRDLFYLITSGQELIPAFDADSLIAKGIALSYDPFKTFEDRWSLADVWDFLKASKDEEAGREPDSDPNPNLNPNPNPNRNSNSNSNSARLFEEIREKLRYYIEFQDERLYDLVTLWIVGTYFTPIFNAYPYLYIGGTKRTGKTKLLSFIAQLAFNAIPSASISTA